MNDISYNDISSFITVEALNEDHHVYLAQTPGSDNIYVKKYLSVYNLSVFKHLLNNPVMGIPKLIAIHEEDGFLTTIEEYVRGTTLKEILESGQKLTDKEVFQYMTELCQTVRALHNLNPPVIHRDIKPSNIIITADNHPVLIDLNAAREGISKEEDTVLLGTTGYAAPEQYGFGSSDIRSDIYALGMLMNTLLWGDFKKEIFPNSPLTGIIRNCTRIDPQKRYSDIDKVLQALSECRLSKTAYRRFLPPGFRTLTISHMLIAIPCYALIIFVFGLINFAGTTGVELWTMRFLIFMLPMSIVFVFTNYLGIQKLFPLCQSESLHIRIIGKILLSLICICLIFLTMFILYGTVFTVPE